jgi:hypothetical protein
MQAYSEGDEDSKDAFYYEREWRLGLNNLDARGDDITNDRSVEERYVKGKAPFHFGKLVKDGDDDFFEFCNDDVYCIIVPKEYIDRAKPLVKGRHFAIEIYENLIRE